MKSAYRLSGLEQKCPASVPLRAFLSNLSGWPRPLYLPHPLGFGTNGKCAMSPIQSQGSNFKYLRSAGPRANHNVPFNRCYCKQLSSSVSRGTNAGRCLDESPRAGLAAIFKGPNIGGIFKYTLGIKLITHPMNRVNCNFAVQSNPGLLQDGRGGTRCPCTCPQCHKQGQFEGTRHR